MRFSLEKMIFAQQWIKHSQECKITVNQLRENDTY